MGLRVEEVIGRAITFVQVPNQRLFAVKAAARYLGIHAQTLRKLVGLGLLEARRMGSRRMFTLEELDRFIEDLPRAGENPRIPFGKRGI